MFAMQDTAWDLSLCLSYGGHRVVNLPACVVGMYANVLSLRRTYQDRMRKTYPARIHALPFTAQGDRLCELVRPRAFGTMGGGGVRGDWGLGWGRGGATCST